jgi:tRNA dimethylallyltransferase
MQVYREIPIITNQGRARPAELAGIVSVAEEWTVAHHKERAEEIIDSLSPEIPFTLDAGTGMYLNALVLDIPLAPKVPREIRAEAEKLAAGATNPRREARRQELELAGAAERGSIWQRDPRYDAAFVYLRPGREDLDRNIKIRSYEISHSGAGEARWLKESGIEPNPSVREAIGVKEMLLYTSGELSRTEAEETIAARTRRLARRQMRWFDKLLRHLPGSTPALIAENAADVGSERLMRDIMNT